MKTLLVMTALLVITAQTDPAATLLGRWRSVETSRGGIGTVVVFEKNGRLDSSPGAIGDMLYRVEGDSLILPSGTSGGPEPRQTLTWLSNDRLRLGTGSQPGLELKRQGSPSGTRTIVGEWVGRQDMGGVKVDATYIFHPGGTGLLVIPFRFERGSYTFANGGFRLTLPGRRAAAASFTVAEDVLALTIDGQTARFRKY